MARTTSVRLTNHRDSAPSRLWRGAVRSARLLLALLLDLGLLPAQLTKVIQLRPAHVAAGQDLDPVDRRAVHRNRPLHPDAETDLTDRERLAQPATLAPDHDALEDLDPGPVALHDPHVHLERVTGTEVRDVGPLRLGVERVQRVHRCCFLVAQ